MFSRVLRFEMIFPDGTNIILAQIKEG